jgi:hypothetical protein
MAFPGPSRDSGSDRLAGWGRHRGVGNSAIDADKAERLIRNLAKQLEREAPGIAASILEGIDEILTVTRLGLASPRSATVWCRRRFACSVK